MRGVAGAFGADDIGLPPLVSPCETPGAYAPPRPLLADGVVRFVGEPVAVVVAESRYAAEDGIDAADVQLDPLEPLVDPLRALAPDAPLLHEGCPNVYVESRVEAGDVEAAFASAAAVIEADLRHGRSTALPLEPRGVVAEPDGDGVVVRATTQVPHKLRLALAATLGLQPGQMRILCTSVGGGFGQKAHVYPEELVAAAARPPPPGRPVKWVEDRRRICSLRVTRATSGCTCACSGRRGRARARARRRADRRPRRVSTVSRTGRRSRPRRRGPCSRARIGCRPSAYAPAAVATNKCPQGAYRGVGFVVAAWVHERVLDRSPPSSDLDRRGRPARNLLRPDELPYVAH